MSNDHDPFEKQLDLGTKFKSDLLDGLDKTEWPDRIDYVASRITDGSYPIGLQSSEPTYLTSGYDLERFARDFYLRGIAALIDDTAKQTALPDDFRLGNLLVEFAGLRDGLETVDRQNVPPGEVLSRLIVRTLQRQADGEEAQLARQLRADAETARELVTELTTAPELASLVDSAMPDSEDPATLTTELASLDLTTELWDHQLESLALWLHHDMNAYVDMATATGKTVLGLAAIAHAVDSGSLHPADQERLKEIFDGELPEPHRNRPNDVLIITTDDLLGVQWARLFQEHCHTPPSFTTIEDSGIQLPWGRIDIRSAGALDGIDPSDYRLAIFDEVHNYSGRSGWGSHLIDFVESACPVLALTGSVTDQLESLTERADRPFPLVYRYTHELALADGVIPDFEWTLTFTDVVDSGALEQFRETAEHFKRIVDYETGTYRVEAEPLADAAPDLSDEATDTIVGEYVSGSAVANGLREAGEEGTAPTEDLETLAGGIGNRTIHRLNLEAGLDPVVAAAERALAQERPVLILTRSYGEAKELWQTLYDRHDDRVVRRLEAGQSASEHDETIRSFDNAEIDRKVLIGPGKRIGQGNDIQSVEVGLNIARSGAGVNATLVQRLGRLLRDAGGKDTVEFYHIIGIPPADATIDPDGEAFVRTVAEFFGQVLEPDTDGILKPPSVDVGEHVESDIVALEHQGAPHLHRDDQATVIESAYATAIDEQNEGTTVDTDWFSAAFGDEAQPDVDDVAGDGRVSVPESESKFNETPDRGEKSSLTGLTGDGHGEARASDNASKPSEPGADDARAADESTGASQNDESTVGDDVDAAEVVSPLAEHFEAFRSLGIVHKALRESAGATIPDTAPAGRWMDDVRSILTETGDDAQKAGYSKQQSDRSPLDINEYRAAKGEESRLTDFETVDVTQVSAAVVALLDDELEELESWVVPVAPDSGEPLPVIVESEGELERARSLLAEFPARPPILGRDPGHDSHEERDPDKESTDGTKESGQNRPTTPVEDVRGVSESVAQSLREAGYERLLDLQQASDDELVAVDGVSEQRVQLIRATVGSKS